MIKFFESLKFLRPAKIDHYFLVKSFRFFHDFFEYNVVSCMGDLSTFRKLKAEKFD